MQRRKFLGGLLALPFVGKLIAEAPAALPEEPKVLPEEPKVLPIEDCGCYSDMDCPPGCRCAGDGERGRCVPCKDPDYKLDFKDQSFIEFSIPMTRAMWEDCVYCDGRHTRTIRINPKGEAGKMMRRIKNSRRR